MTTLDMADGPGIDAPSKVARILRLFLEKRSLNRFEAERHHDHCLHSTVSALQSHGIQIDRQWETVPCLVGRATTRCKRYWLRQTEENIRAAHGRLTSLPNPEPDE